MRNMQYLFALSHFADNDSKENGKCAVRFSEKEKLGNLLNVWISPGE